VADTFPIDQGDSRGARAELVPIARLDVPVAEVEAEARRLWAERDLRVHAFNAGMTSDEYRLAGLLAEQRHQLYDLDADSAYTIPGACRYPCPNAGGAA
jgi:hypothetical protein